MHPRTRARLLAMRTLAGLEGSERPLNAILEGLGASSEPLGFARELASGATRWRSRLDWTLQPLLKKPIDKLDAPVRAALRLALYERVALETPASAIANEYAGLMREVKLKSAVGFVNAVARRLPGAWREPPPREKNEARHLALETAHPGWLAKRWIERLGFEAAADLCRANNQIAPLDLRVNTLRASREQVLEALQERGIAAHPTPLSPHGIRIARAVHARGEEIRGEESGADDGAPQVLAGDAAASSTSSTNSHSPWRWPEWAEGLLLAQDEAAQLVALCLGAGQGERILDVASAPGGKATHLAQIAGAQTRIVAADRSGDRLGKVRDNVNRLRLENVDFLQADALQVLGRVQSGELEPFDRVLLDAPCSGTGTLRRRPDAKWRKSAQNLGELVELQRELLEIAAACVRAGGRLCYSTCSLEEEENEQAVRHFLSRHTEWRLEAPCTLLLPGPAWQKLQAARDLPGAIATSPARDGCDGMFCCVLRRG